MAILYQAGKLAQREEKSCRPIKTGSARQFYKANIYRYFRQFCKIPTMSPYGFSRYHRYTIALPFAANTLRFAGCYGDGNCCFPVKMLIGRMGLSFYPLNG